MPFHIPGRLGSECRCALASAFLHLKFPSTRSSTLHLIPSSSVLHPYSHPVPSSIQLSAYISGSLLRDPPLLARGLFTEPLHSLSRSGRHRLLINLVWPPSLSPAYLTNLPGDPYNATMADVSSTRLYLGNLPRNSMAHLHLIFSFGWRLP